MRIVYVLIALVVVSLPRVTVAASAPDPLQADRAHVYQAMQSAARRSFALYPPLLRAAHAIPHKWMTYEQVRAVARQAQGACSSDAVDAARSVFRADGGDANHTPLIAQSMSMSAWLQGCFAYARWLGDAVDIANDGGTNGNPVLFQKVVHDRLPWLTNLYTQARAAMTAARATHH